MNAQRRSFGLALVGLGVLFLLAGWLRLRDAEILADQVSFLASSGIGGVALVMAGLAFIASANSRDETTGRLTKIEAVIRREAGEEVR